MSLTAANVASLLGISARKVYALVARNEIAFYRFGDALRFDLADVEAYKATQPAALGLMPARVLREYERLRKRAVAIGATDLPALSPEQQAIADERVRNLRPTLWADKDAIAALYAEAKRLTSETGNAHHVDHVIPLLGTFVSGLHVESNLRVLPWRDNIAKGNRYEVE